LTSPPIVPILVTSGELLDIRLRDWKMAWTHKDAYGFCKLADNPARARAWADAANYASGRGMSDEAALKMARDAIYARLKHAANRRGQRRQFIQRLL
jgi:hypothetical protein